MPIQLRSTALLFAARFILISSLGLCSLCYKATCLTGKPDVAVKIDSLLHEKTTTPFHGVVLISQAGKTLYSTVMGYADIPKAIPLQSDSRFIIGSISKQITAVLVLQEFEKKHLQLDVPIHRYLPELQQAWADTVTVHHLLTHLHGIVALDKPTLFTPGTQFDYNLANLGYSLLTTIVERTSGKSFMELSHQLFQQCGMKNTFHPSVKNIALVKGYTRQENGELQFEQHSFQNAPAAGGFISTAHDLVIWNEHLHNGKLLAPATYSMMTTKQRNALRQHPVWGATDYGYGITIDTKENILQLGQTGFAPGFISMNFYFPQTKTSVVVLGNVVYTTTNFKELFRYHAQILGILRKYLLTREAEAKD